MNNTFHSSHLYPFGMQVKDRSWSDSSFSYRFGFNGMESDDEVSGGGNSYTAEFWQYDTRLGRRFNVDPVVNFHSSNYSCFSNSPIIFVDPNGNSDYYSQKGNYLGSDGTKETDIIVITNNKVVKNIWKTNKEAIGERDYVEVNIELAKGDFYILPSYENRQVIDKIMVHFDVGDKKGAEVGGRGLLVEGSSKVEHFRSRDGIAPKVGEISKIDLTKVHEDDIDRLTEIVSNKTPTVIFDWHAHADLIEYSIDKGNTWMTLEAYDDFQVKKRMSSIGTTTTISTEGPMTRKVGEGASDNDIDDLKDTNTTGYVLTPKFNKVYIYDANTKKSSKGGNGYDASFPLDKFLTLKAKSNPKQ
jgi:RHS repeat-associated protein